MTLEKHDMTFIILLPVTGVSRLGKGLKNFFLGLPVFLFSRIEKRLTFLWYFPDQVGFHPAGSTELPPFTFRLYIKNIEAIHLLIAIQKHKLFRKWISLSENHRLIYFKL